MKKTDLIPWIEATRPKTLAAGIIPVLIGSSAAATVANVDWLIAPVILICAILIQIFTNFVNEIYDFRRGADSEKRVGPKRQVAEGKISIKAMSIASLLIAAFAFGLGMILVAKAGLPILIIGLLSLVFAFAYTGGPYPLAYNGLGDIFVFIFFGLFAVCGTYYVFAGEIGTVAILASIPPGLLSANILAVNNIRDIDTDPDVGKRTLAVKLGLEKSILLYKILNVCSYLAIFAIANFTLNIFVLLPLLTLPYMIKLNKQVSVLKGSELNGVLAGTGKLLFIFGILLSIGFNLKL